MLNFFLNSKKLLVFVLPFLLGCTTVFSFQPYNITIINFFVFPLLFLILCVTCLLLLSLVYKSYLNPRFFLVIFLERNSLLTFAPGFPVEDPIVNLLFTFGVLDILFVFTFDTFDVLFALKGFCLGLLLFLSFFLVLYVSVL